MAALVVGAAGFELATYWSQTNCATRLRYAPNERDCTSQEQRDSSAEVGDRSTSSSETSVIFLPSGMRLGPDLLEALDAHRLRRLQLLGEEAHAKLLEPPGELVEA